MSLVVIKARGIERAVRGRLRHETLVVPDGIDPIRATPAEAPAPGRETCWIVDERDAPTDAVRARREDIPKRTDLPKNHPLYGQRVLTHVPAGMGDCTVNEAGELVLVGQDEVKP